ncbi:MAG TPA: DUF1629 domain-containing protein, partial [Herpetosiphonaceae bacterium]
FNERAWQVLEPLLGQSVEALPLRTDEHTYYAINVLVVLDCLDMDRSEIQYFPSGGIMYIDRYVFEEGCVDEHPIFKIQGAELKEVLVSEQVKAVVEQNHLAGFVFVPIASPVG